MKAYGVSHIGKIRTTNEDSYIVQNKVVGSLPNLYIVADGMGGHSAGEVASQTSIVAFFDFVTGNRCTDGVLDFLVEGAKFANSSVYESSVKNESYSGMGTTFTSLSIIGKKGYVSHIGDSRIYLINDGIKQITEDHSYVNELVKEGKLTAEEAEHHPYKHIMTRALGIEPEAEIDGLEFDLQTGDKIFICSDGLTNMVDDESIMEIVQANPVQTAAELLVMLANGNGGVDNITLIIIEMEEEDDVA